MNSFLNPTDHQHNYISTTAVNSSMFLVALPPKECYFHGNHIPRPLSSLDLDVICILETYNQLQMEKEASNQKANPGMKLASLSD